jgi:hypothetical protein
MSGGIAPPLNLGTRWRWVVSFTPRQVYPGKKPPVPTGQEAGWAPEPFLTLRGSERSLAPGGNWTQGVRPVARRYTNWAIPTPWLITMSYSLIMGSEGHIFLVRNGTRGLLYMVNWEGSGPWSRALVKLTVSQIVKRPSAFHGTPSFIAWHKSPPLDLSQMNPVHTLISGFFKIRLNIILSLHLCLPNGLFLSGFPTECLYALFVSREWVSIQGLFNDTKEYYSNKIINVWFLSDSLVKTCQLHHWMRVRLQGKKWPSRYSHGRAKESTPNSPSRLEFG